MKNALNYYYNLNPTSIHQVNKNYRCYINGEEYLLTLYENEHNIIEEILQLNKYLLQIKVPCHQIISNNSGSVITLINNLPYILLKVFVQNRPVNIGDILFFSHLRVETKYFKNLVRNSWYEMWIKKIDYFEYQISQVGRKYPIIRDSINYYIGLAENSISLSNNLLKNIERDLVISHRRIKKNDGLIELYNPLNFIIDNRIRDLSEYIKEQFFFNQYSLEEAKRDISQFGLNIELYGILFTRLMFPSYYFDCYEEVIMGKCDEDELVKIISKNEKYIELLKEIYAYLRTFSNLPEIEWLIKM